MNYTYIYNSYKQPDIIFADFYNEIWTIIILCVLILTRGIVSTIIKLIETNEPQHVRYSNEHTAIDLNILPKAPPRPQGGAVLSNSDSDIDVYEHYRNPPPTPKHIRTKPKPPPRDALV